MKRLVKWIIISAILSEIVLPILLIVMLIGVSHTTEYIKSPRTYEEALVVCEATDSFMPDISELGDCEAVAFDYDKETILIFTAEMITLATKYDEENFEKQKQILDEKYTFLDNPIGSAPYYDIPQPVFECDDFVFRVVGNEEEYDYPKSFGMIAYSEEENEIVYLWYHDPDQDYVDNMDFFVEENFPKFDDLV